MITYQEFCRLDLIWSSQKHWEVFTIIIISTLQKWKLILERLNNFPKATKCCWDSKQACLHYEREKNYQMQIQFTDSAICFLKSV